MKDGAVIELTNVHSNPIQGFRMDPSDIVLHFSDATATWHTHPGADPNLSEEDYAGFLQWPELIHHIAGLRDGEPTVCSYQVLDGVLVQL